MRMMNHSPICCRNPRSTGRHKFETGFNLLEVMIALVVLAVGLLGLAALQNFSLKATHQSYQRTQATFLIHEIFDRMRANSSAITAYVRPTYTDTVAGPNCALTVCTPATLALYDLQEWTTAMKSDSGLGPSGKMRIQMVPSFPVGGTPGFLVTVTLTWVEGQGRIQQAAGGFNPIQMNQTLTAYLP